MTTLLAGHPWTLEQVRGFLFFKGRALGMVMKKEALNLALVHVNVSYGDVKKNKKSLFSLNEKAAADGADLILNTEMAPTGFSFDSRDEIGRLIKDTQNQVFDHLAALTRRYRTSICIGRAECDPLTGIFYNSAFLLEPAGYAVCRRPQRRLYLDPPGRSLSLVGKLGPGRRSMFGRNRHPQNPPETFSGPQTVLLTPGSKMAGHPVKTGKEIEVPGESQFQVMGLTEPWVPSFPESETRGNIRTTLDEVNNNAPK